MRKGLQRQRRKPWEKDLVAVGPQELSLSGWCSAKSRILPMDDLV